MNVMLATWYIRAVFCRMSRWSRALEVMREGGKVNTALKQDHPCLLLSIPHKYKPLQVEKNIFGRSMADHICALEIKIPHWAMQLLLGLLLD